MSNRAILAALLTIVMTGALQAQEPQAAGTSQSTRASSGNQVGLKVQVVLSRYQGDKKVSSLPYTLGVLVNGTKTSLRMRQGLVTNTARISRTTFTPWSPITSSCSTEVLTIDAPAFAASSAWAELKTRSAATRTPSVASLRMATIASSTSGIWTTRSSESRASSRPCW